LRPTKHLIKQVMKIAILSIVTSVLMTEGEEKNDGPFH
jgi:hypothetical protein